MAPEPRSKECPLRYPRHYFDEKTKANQHGYKPFTSYGR